MGQKDPNKSAMTKPNLAEFEGKGFEISFRNFIQINISEKLTAEKKPLIGKSSKSPNRHLDYNFM